jgi:hypothetical protein
MNENLKNIHEKNIVRENICCCNHEHHNENKFYFQVDDTQDCEDCDECCEEMSNIEKIIGALIIAIIISKCFNKLQYNC